MRSVYQRSGRETLTFFCRTFNKIEEKVSYFLRTNQCRFFYRELNIHRLFLANNIFYIVIVIVLNYSRMLHISIEKNIPHRLYDKNADFFSDFIRVFPFYSVSSLPAEVFGTQAGVVNKKGE